MKNNFNDKSFINVDGHVLIKDVDSGEILLDKHNAINYENMSLAIAHLLTNQTDPITGLSHFITEMAYGNGGTTIDSVGLITYKTPNVTDAAGTLYNQTYVKSITSTTDVNNSMSIYHSALQNYTDIVVTSTLSYGEPEGQDDIDTATTKTDFVFDEIGLINELGSTLTHIIFHPIQKSANRKLQVVYTLRIKVGS
jgi:hypothetical protein